MNSKKSERAALEGSSFHLKKRLAIGSNSGVRALRARKRLQHARSSSGEIVMRCENDKEQDSRRTPTSTRQRNQRRTPGTTNPNSSQERHLGATGTNDIGRYPISTAEPRHNMGRTKCY